MQNLVDTVSVQSSNNYGETVSLHQSPFKLKGDGRQSLVVLEGEEWIGGSD